MLVEGAFLRMYEPVTDRRATTVALIRRLSPVLLTLATVGFYVRTLNSGLYLDDYWLVRRWTSHEVLHAFVGQFDPSGLNPEYFRPFAGVSFAIDWAVWGASTWGPHITNLVIHVGAVLLVHRLLLRLDVRWWAALGGASFFAVIPSNVAAVVYVAERTDAMAACCVVAGLLCLRRYELDRRPRWLVALNGAFVLAVLSKEIGLALVPAAAMYWWYLRLEARSTSGTAEPADVGIIRHWRREVVAWWRIIAQRSERRSWIRVLGPLVGLTVVYLVYRTSVLPAGALDGRFGESHTPPHALVSGMVETFRGVPWELRGWTVVPLATLFIGALVLQPRARAWRTVVLGIGLMAAGCAPLLFSGGVEPRLLYVAEIGMAVAVAAVLSVWGDGIAVARARRSQPLLVSGLSAAMVGALAVTTFVVSMRAQDLFSPSSPKKLGAELDVFTRPGARQYVPPAQMESIRQDLVDAHLIQP